MEGVPPATLITVAAVRLSDMIDGPVDLLKMDIEGSEYDVIADLSQSGQLFSGEGSYLRGARHPSTRRQFADLWQHLIAAGFHLSLFDARVGGDLQETRFSVIPGKDYAIILYAWRQ